MKRLFGQDRGGGKQRALTALDGVSVKIDGVNASPSFISPGQLNVLIPEGFSSDAKAMVTVTNAQGTSNASPMFVFPTAPELFRSDPAHRKYAAAVHPDGTLVGSDGLSKRLLASRKTVFQSTATSSSLYQPLAGGCRRCRNRPQGEGLHWLSWIAVTFSLSLSRWQPVRESQCFPWRRWRLPL
ncbi:MAG: hypothetical protein U5J83_03700 [Bryobacterales bacterium]|nr:hypothetical protein [Bryobacterales bacterium]